MSSHKRAPTVTSFSGNPPAGNPPAGQINAYPAPTAAATSTSEVKVTHDSIAQAAYLRWQKQGGDAVTNWVEAEKELRAAADAARRASKSK